MTYLICSMDIYYCSCFFFHAEDFNARSRSHSEQPGPSSMPTPKIGREKDHKISTSIIIKIIGFLYKLTLFSKKKKKTCYANQ